MEKMKMDPYFTAYIVINFKYMKNLNMKYTIIKPLKQMWKNIFMSLGQGNNSLNRTQKSLHNKETYITTYLRTSVYQERD